MKLETPIVRVFRGETWLTVYRSIAVRVHSELVGPGAVQRKSMKKCDGNQKLFARSQLWAYKSGKGSRRCLNLQI